MFESKKKLMRILQIKPQNDKRNCRHLIPRGVNKGRYLHILHGWQHHTHIAYHKMIEPLALCES